MALILGLVVVVVLGLVVAHLARTRAAAHDARIRSAATVRAAGAKVVRSEDLRSLGLEPGVKARGARSNGTLVLTADEIRFARWVPAEDVVVPRHAIRAVDVTTEHSGTATGREALRVRWRVGGGQEQVMAFETRDLDAWLDALGAPRR